MRWSRAWLGGAVAAWLLAACSATALGDESAPAAVPGAAMPAAGEPATTLVPPGAAESEAANPVQLAPISVTATRSAPALADPTAAVSEIAEGEVKRSAARSLDDLLRRIPGFSLFRRLGSGAAHPTTQGVSLRGIGASGTSRALVLVDGVPINDPFGGWIYWSRIPSETIERVEVLRGSGASLWGNYAMGGVVGVVTRAPDRNAGGFVAEGGERGSARTEAWLSRRFGSTSAIVDGRWTRSGDYPLVSDGTRGPVDVPGGSEHESGGFSIEHQLNSATRLRLGARGFHEYRDNGTPYAHNETTSGFLRTGIEVDTASAGTFTADIFGTLQSFWSTFSAVAPDRASELPAADQYSVPSQSAGGSLVWSHKVMQRHQLVGGIDALWVDGQSQELARFLDGSFTRRRDGGASQVMTGIFLSDLVELTPRLDMTGALRVDYWESYDAFRREDALDTGAALVDRSLGGRSETFLSPRVGLAFAATAGLTLRSAVYRGFRAPTINEQVRPFRVRNDITEANEALSAEKLFGVEAGFDHRSSRWRSSATLFWNEVEDPVVNVTVGEGGGVVEPCGFVPEGGVCRQRRNLGSTHILGIETALGVDLGGGFSTTLGYLFSDGSIHSAREDPSLVGNRIPQVPLHQGTIAFDYDEGGPWRASLQMRVVGEQYDDDANSRRLDRFVAVDAFVARTIGAGFEVFVAAENLFDETIESGRSADGVVSIAAPRLVRAGLRYTFDATPELEEAE
ncbi:MAG: TonB-dependent receptor domain-containing protein [Candidatus Binatia bacterium]